MHNPRTHYQAELWILRYLIGAFSLGLIFKKIGKLALLIYAEHDYGSSLVDHKSTTRYCTVLGGNLVTWGK